MQINHPILGGIAAALLALWLLGMLRPLVAAAVSKAKRSAGRYRPGPRKFAAGVCFSLAAGLLAAAAAGVTVIAAGEPTVVVLIDLSPSTRGAAYRDPAVVSRRIDQLIPGRAYTIRAFADGPLFAEGTLEVALDNAMPESPTAEDSRAEDSRAANARADDLQTKDLQTGSAGSATDAPRGTPAGGTFVGRAIAAGERATRTRLPAVAADAMLLFSDGRFPPPPALPPTFAVIDPGLLAARDAQVLDIRPAGLGQLLTLTRTIGPPAQVRLPDGSVTDAPEGIIGHLTPLPSDQRPPSDTVEKMAQPASLSPAESVWRPGDLAGAGSARGDSTRRDPARRGSTQRNSTQRSSTQRSSTQRSSTQGDVTQGELTRAEASVLTPDRWPENDALRLPPPAAEAPKRWYVSATASSSGVPPGFEVVPPDAFSTDAARFGPWALAGVDFIAIHPDAAARLTPAARGQLNLFVSRLGGTLALTQLAGEATAFDDQSPLSPVPPQPRGTIIFLLDRSGSMAQPASEGASAGASAGVNGAGGIVSPAAGLSRWQAARAAIASAVAGLPPETRVGLVAFAENPSWVVTPRTLKAGFLEQFARAPATPPAGPTNLRHAIETLLADRPAAGRLDLIIVTDAAAALPDPAALAKRLPPEWHTHLLAIDSADGSPTQQLARATGGVALTPTDAADWPAALRQITRTAAGAGTDVRPRLIRFLRPLESVPPRTAQAGRAWLRQGARAIAVSPDDQPLAAEWNVGAGAIVAASFVPDAREWVALADRYARHAADDRLAVEWSDDPAKTVTLLAAESATPPSPANTPKTLPTLPTPPAPPTPPTPAHPPKAPPTAGTLPTRPADDQSADTQEPADPTAPSVRRPINNLSPLLRRTDAQTGDAIDTRPLQQIAPGRYRATAGLRGRAVVADVLLDGKRISRRVIPAGHAPEFDRIGIDEQSLRSLADRTGGRLVGPNDAAPLALPGRPRPLALAPWLALAAAVLLLAGLLVRNPPRLGTGRSRSAYKPKSRSI